MHYRWAISVAVLCVIISGFYLEHHRRPPEFGVFDFPYVLRALLTGSVVVFASFCVACIYSIGAAPEGLRSLTVGFFVFFAIFVGFRMF